MLDPIVLKNPWVRAIAAALAIALAVLVAYFLRPVLVPLFFAFIVAYVFDPVVDFFERRRIPRMVTILVLGLIGISIAVAGPLFLVPRVIHESENVIQVARERIKEVDPAAQRDAVDRWLHSLPLDSLVESLGWRPEGLAPEEEYDPLAVIVERGSTALRENAGTALKDYGSRIFSVGQAAGTGVVGALRSIGTALRNFVFAVGNVALFAVVAGYLLRDYDAIVAAAGELVPPARRPRVFDVMRKIDGQLRGFMRGQAVVCLFLAIIYATGLTISDVPFGLYIGILGGAASFVPYLGIALTILPSAVLCIVQHGGVDWHLGAVAATFIIGQLLESTVITPKVVGESVGLGPVWVILAVLVFGGSLGFLGLLLAVPTAATLKVLVAEAIVDYKRSRIFAPPTKPQLP
jgi:predicted PurR-regulated permease PerM